MKKLLLTAALTLLLSACGEKPVADRAVGKWQVVTTALNTDKALCYAVTSPISSSGTFSGKRAAPYLMATRRASGKVEISTFSGYSYLQHSKLEIAAGKKAFQLGFKDNVGWARGDAQDKVIVTAIKSATTVDVRGVTRDGETTVDTYSATGFADALARVKVLCP